MKDSTQYQIIDSRVDRMFKEFDLVNATYLEPMGQGVKGIEIPGCIKKSFYEQLIYLEDSSKHGLLDKHGNELLKKIKDMGTLLGFDYNHFRNSKFLYSPGEIDLTYPLPTKGKYPYFVWHLTLETIIRMKHHRSLPYNIANERSLGTIVDSRNDVDPHYLKIEKIGLENGIDTKLSIQSSDNSEEKYFADYYMKEGKLVKTTENGMNSKFELSINNMGHYLGIGPQHLRFYLNNSNLTEIQKGTLKELLLKLDPFEKVKPEILFPGYGIKKNFVVSKFFGLK